MGYNPTKFGDREILSISLSKVLLQLSEEERDIIYLWVVEELSFEQMGVIIGEKYRGRPLTGSVIRYHRDKILDKLRRKFRIVM